MQGEVHSEPDFDGIIGQSPELKAALALARKVAESDAPVLILGEVGSGKESIARAIHRMSARRNAAFVKVNCATTASGQLEQRAIRTNEGKLGRRPQPEDGPARTGKPGHALPA